MRVVRRLQAVHVPWGLFGPVDGVHVRAVIGLDEVELDALFLAWLHEIDDSPLDFQTLQIGSALVETLAVTDAGEAARLRACLRKGAWATKYRARGLSMDEGLSTDVRWHAARLAWRAFTVRGFEGE